MAAATAEPIILTRALPAGTWKADPVHSSVQFSVRNMGIVTVNGHFTDFDGTVTSDGTLEGTHIEGVAQSASIDTRSETRDEHLRADDFFAVEQHPEIRFASTRVEPGYDGLKVVGDLTIRGVTKEVEFDLEPDAEPIEDPWGGTRIGLEVDGEVDRRDFGLNWDVRTPAGVPLASHHVKLAFHLGLVRQQEESA